MGLPRGIKKKQIHQFFYNKNILKLIKKIQNFFIFERLIHEINLIALESLKKN